MNLHLRSSAVIKNNNHNIILLSIRCNVQVFILLVNLWKRGFLTILAPLLYFNVLLCMRAFQHQQGNVFLTTSNDDQ